MDIKRVLFKCFFSFLIKSPKMKICRTSNSLKNYTKHLLENLENKKYTHLLLTTFGVLILLICTHLLSKFNKGIWFLICGIDIFSKYARVISLKDKAGITITNAFQKILDESNHQL